MKIALIICTYMRPRSLEALLDSVQGQTQYPHQVIVVDGSRDTLTSEMIDRRDFANLNYFLVDEQNRGLTRQRNFGIAKVLYDVDIVSFLDDDILLEPDYFMQLAQAYKQFPDALGVGGYVTNEADWKFVGTDYEPSISEFYFDGWIRLDPSRFVMRKKLGLDSDLPPGFLPEFSHGRSVGFLPPSGKTYPVQQLIGCVFSFRKEVFNTFSFSTYFEGYGLYEDADFTLRVSNSGPLYVNTAARLQHFHDPLGRPNLYNYGKMVVRNGYYVWRIAWPKPSVRAIAKWHIITLMLAAIRFGNALSGPKRMQALTEATGRMTAWAALFFNKPTITR